eukprot:6026024-Pyramimonas_sp.AAC.1
MRRTSAASLANACAWLVNTLNSFYGSSYANNSEGALNTHHSPSPFLALCPVPHVLPPLLCMVGYERM